MRQLGLVEESKLFRDALLSSKVVRALRHATMEKSFDEIDQSALQHAIELMETIIRGSLLIERKLINGFRPSADGLSNFGYALAAVDGSQLHEGTFGELFLDYRNKLIELGSGTELSKGTLEELLAFFLGFRKQCSEPIGL